MRWLGRALLVLVLILVIGPVAAWFTRDHWAVPAVKWSVNAWAESTGATTPVIGRLNFRIDTITPASLALTGVDVNGERGLRADRIEVNYAWRDLIAGRLRAISLVRPRLHVTVGADGGVRLGDLEALIEALRAVTADTGGGDTGRLPVVQFTEAEIAVDGAADGRITVAGTVGETDGALGVAADGAAVLTAANWRIDGAGRVLATLQDGRMRINATLTGARAQHGTLTAEGLRGTASVDIAGSDVSAIADLRAERAEAEGIPLAVPSAHLRLDPLGLSAVFRLGERETPHLRLAVAADAPDGGRRSISVDLSAELATLDRLVAAAREEPARQLDGRVSGTLSGSTPDDLADMAAVFRGTVAAGKLDLDAAGPELEAHVRLGLALAAGQVSAETLTPASFAMTPEGLPASFSEILGDGPVKAVFGEPARAFRVLLADPLGTAAVSIGGPATATAASGAEARFDGEARMAPGDGMPALESARGRLSLTRVDLDGARLREVLVDLESLSARGGDLAGIASVTARIDTPDVKGIAIALPLRVARDGNGTAVFLRAAGEVSVPEIPPAGGVTVLGPVSVRFSPSPRPIFRQGFGDGNAIRLELPFALKESALEVAGGTALRIALAPATGVAKGRFEGPRGGVVLRLSTTAIDAIPVDEVPDEPDGISLAGVAMEVTATTGGTGFGIDRMVVSANRMTDRSRHVRFAPLRVEGEARRVASDGLEFTSTFRGANGAFVLDAKGFHDVATGSGRAYLTLYSLVFVPGGLQPVSLSPAAAALFRQASGKVSLNGAVVWPGTEVPPDEPLTMTVEDLSFTGSLGTVSGLSGAVTLSGIDPLGTPRGQTLTATAIDVGVPIAAPSVSFHLDADLALVLETVTATFADGHVHARDVRIPLTSGDPVAMVLDVDGVDAAKLAAVTDLDGLTATGSLSGQLPLQWDYTRGLSLRRARLAATTQGGTVRYRPANPPPGLRDGGEEVSLLMQAVRNLIYEQFEIEANGRPGEPFDIKLRVRGANPDLYDGYPVALNVSLSGRLDEMFLNARRTLGLSDVIKRRLEARGAGG